MWASLSHNKSGKPSYWYTAIFYPKIYYLVSQLLRVLRGEENVWSIHRRGSDKD